jgi:hypothetical protein
MTPRRSTARALRAAGLALWKAADRIHPPENPDDWADYWAEEWDDNASHDTAHPYWVEGCSACIERAERRETAHREAARHRHPSATPAAHPHTTNVIPITTTHRPNVTGATP